MMRFLKLLTIFFLLFHVLNGKAQEYNFRTIPSPRGSIWGLVTDIAQDPEDNLWFSSWYGLHKYDGNTFISYRPDPLNPGSTSISASDPQTVCADRNGYIWVGSALGLDRLDPQTGIFTHFRNNPVDTTSLPANYINDILEDHDGNIWIGTDGGLSLFNNKTGGFTNYRYSPSDTGSLSYNTVRVLYEDKKGTLWVGCGSAFTPSTGGGLNRMDRQTGRFTRYSHKEDDATSLIDDRVSAILEDSRGIFWIGTAGDGLHTLDRATGLFKRLQYNPAKPENLSRPPVVKTSDLKDHITFITEDATGIIWIGTLQGGLTRYDPAKGNVIHYNNGKNNTPLFKDKMFWRGFTSRDGLLWMSTWEGNLYKIDPYRKTSPFHPLGFKVGAVYEEDPGTLWIGTESKGLIRKNLLNNEQKEFTHVAGNPYSISTDTIDCILKTSEQKLWIGTPRGLNRFDRDKNQFVTYKHDPKNKNSLHGDTILVMYEDSKKNLWIGTWDGGLNRRDHQTGSFIHFTYDPSDSTGISNDAVTSIYEDNRQHLWIGTWGGLNRMDMKSGKFLHYLGNLSITSIYQDKGGTIWTGAPTGLFFLDKQSGNFKSFIEPVSGTKLTAHILSITEDGKRNLWIRTRDKIMRINNKRDELKIFGEEWGIDVNDNYWAHAMVGRKGNIVFSDHYGYFSFFPDQMTADTHLPRLILSELRVQNETMRPGKNGVLNEALSKTKTIHLNYRQNTFSFDFKAVDFRSGGNNQFIFILENYEKEWRKASADRTANYYNVPPGEYTFRVKVSSSEGQWVEKAIQIIITPPWWRTWWAYALYALLFIAAVWSFIYYRSRSLRRENLILEEKVNQRTSQLKQSLEELKAAQAQLIQSEKMASLGELTAGIAHEIQNPLNFVNNFSEVSSELVHEMKQELATGNLKPATEIANDIEQNLEKIIHHGKRADAIVKGMLQHTRKSTGQKEPTDINALCDEYLRLAYHGMRAKDKDFNATLKTDFDENIGKINVIPQDIGRVLLNLYNNAFYATADKLKARPTGSSGRAHSSQLTADSSQYVPTVTVVTKKSDDKILISVKDNGPGIPQNIVDKIFQPFFTTKPTGEGTGLGLSLSYDIIKAHGGEISAGSGGKVEMKGDEALSAEASSDAIGFGRRLSAETGSEFIITLPA